MSAEDRAGVLDEAKGYVTKDRNTSYGEPEDNFTAIASIWNAQGLMIDGRPLVATDVALLMAGMKLARLRSNVEHRDSWVDAIGYLACGGGVVAANVDPDLVNVDSTLMVWPAGNYGPGQPKLRKGCDPGCDVVRMIHTDSCNVESMKRIADTQG